MLLPWLGGYEVVEEVEELEGGARLTRLVRKYPTNDLSSARQNRAISLRRRANYDSGTGATQDTEGRKRRSNDEREPLL